LDRAIVFCDMVSRSAPLCGEVQRMTVALAHDFAIADSAIYDLGRSGGTTLVNPCSRCSSSDRSGASA
jgi:hypothetical protein